LAVPTDRVPEQVERRRSTGDGMAAQGPPWAPSQRGANDANTRGRSNSSHVFEVAAPFLFHQQSGRAESVPAPSPQHCNISPKHQSEAQQAKVAQSRKVQRMPSQPSQLPTSSTMLPTTSLSHIAESRSGREGSESFMKTMMMANFSSVVSSSDMDEAESEVDEWRKQRRHQKRSKEKGAMVSLASPRSVNGVALGPLVFSDLDETDTDLDVEPTARSARAVRAFGGLTAPKPKHSALLRVESTNKWDEEQIEQQTDEMAKHMQYMQEMAEQRESEKDLRHWISE